MASMAKRKQKIKEPKIEITWKEIKRQKVLLIWSAAIVLYGIIFYYLPLGGWIMAFQNYRPKGEWRCLPFAVFHRMEGTIKCLRISNTKEHSGQCCFGYSYMES